MSINYLRIGESLNIGELSKIINKANGLLTVAKNSEWRAQLENLKSAADKLRALIIHSGVKAETPSGSRSIAILETTFQKMIADYIYKRRHFKTKMEWQSEFSKDKIVVHLEEKPSTQESLGYYLTNEAEYEPKE